MIDNIYKHTLTKKKNYTELIFQIDNSLNFKLELKNLIQC